MISSDRYPSESTTSDSEDEGEIPLETRAQFGLALEKIRSRDTSIYDITTQFFTDLPSKDRESANEDTALYLKDVRARQLLEFGAEAYESEEDEEDLEAISSRQERLMYNSEQAGNREELLAVLHREEDAEDSVSESEEFGGLIKTEHVPNPSSTLNETQSLATVKKAQQHLDAYFANVTDFKKEDAEFLRDYIEKEEWRVDKLGADDEIDDQIDLEQDEEYLERGEEFEADYNYRFEEPGSHQITTYPRGVDGVMRQTESKRKRQRTNKAERKRKQKLLEEQEIKEEKNQKKTEIQQKLRELNEVCGGGVDVALLQDLIDSENEFDEGKWDKRMEQSFNEIYYDKYDADFELPTTESPMTTGEATRLPSFEREDVDRSEEIEKPHKTELKRLMKQYQKLDREDTIDNIKCRYRYIKVPERSFGLESVDVLLLDDKKLNEYVGLRRLNPYRDDLPIYQHNQWKLQKLMSDIDYRGTQTQGKETPAEPLSDFQPGHGRIEQEAIAEKNGEEVDPNVKARLQSYSHDTLRPFRALKKATAGPRPSIASLPPRTSPDLPADLSKSLRKNIKRRRKRHRVKSTPS